MPIFIIGAIKYFLANRWLWIVGAAMVVVAFYFGWRSHQRGVGARKVIEQLMEEDREATRKMEEAGRRYRRDGGARERLRRGEY